MTIQQAIQKAIKGGYTRGVANVYETLLYAEFWQCLGKAMGWGTDMFHEDDGKTYWDYYMHCYSCGEIMMDIEGGCENECQTDNAEVVSWLYEMHRMIDHLAEGKSIEEFFKQL